MSFEFWNQDIEFPEKYREPGAPFLIGSGVSSKVYGISGGKYAVKVLECGCDESKYELAMHEIMIMKTLASVTGTVKYFDHEVMENVIPGIKGPATTRNVFIREEYLKTLTNILDDGKLTVGQAIRLAVDICDAAKECRDAGVYHLDIQPKNIFFREEENRFVLGDFGSSLKLSEIADNIGTRGTLAYLAPEVYRGEGVSEQSEIYSLGVVLYGLLNSRALPFTRFEMERVAILQRLAGTPLPKPCLLGDNGPVSEKLFEIINRACAFFPDKRYSCFEELSAELKAVLQSTEPVMYKSIIQEKPKLPPIVTGVNNRPCFDADEFAKSIALSIPPSPVNFTPPSPVNFTPTGPVNFIPPSPVNFTPTGPANFIPPSPVNFNPSGSVNAAPLVPEVPALDKVQFSAIAPRVFKREEYSTIDLFMYEEAFRAVVDEAIAQAEGPVNEKKSGLLLARKGTEVKVVLTSPDLEIEDNEDSGRWVGEYLNFTFVVELPQTYSKSQILFVASVYFDDVIATRLKFVAKVHALFRQKISITREDVESAFVSYASQDRSHVAMIVQGMRRARPDMDIFFDVDSLRSGDNWEQTLWSEIDSRDTLFLCWSRNASKSEWVDAEWRYALNHKGIECIEPIPLDPPDACPPPEELKQKHFNDKMLYIIQAGTKPLE